MAKNYELYVYNDNIAYNVRNDYRLDVIKSKAAQYAEEGIHGYITSNGKCIKRF